MRIRTSAAIAGLLLSVNIACSDDNVSSTNKGPDKQSLSTPGSTANTVASDAKIANSTENVQPQNEFITRAAEGGLAEVELSRVASEKAVNPEVKKFADMMIADHGKANGELKAIADPKGVTLPAALAPDHEAKLAELRGLSGAGFDRAYVDAMVADHEKTVALFRSQSSDGDTAMPDVKAWAAKTLPTLEGHLKMIKEIQGKMK